MHKYFSKYFFLELCHPPGPAQVKNTLYSLWLDIQGWKNFKLFSSDHIAGQVLLMSCISYFAMDNQTTYNTGLKVHVFTIIDVQLLKMILILLQVSNSRSARDFQSINSTIHSVQ